MRDIEHALRTELIDPEYSEGYSESFLNAYVATQIKVIREQRKWTQAELANEIGTTQTGISRIENVNYSSWSIRTLIKLARAFKVRLKVSFEPYGTLPGEVVRFNREFLERPKREDDPGLKEYDSSRDDRIIDMGWWKDFKSGDRSVSDSDQLVDKLVEGSTFYVQQMGGANGYATSGSQ
jgi:transcriptional regulator with XRE-family HTH domain